MKVFMGVFQLYIARILTLLITVTRDTKRLTGMNRYKEMREWGGLLEGLAGTCQIVPELPPLPS